jgi:class 3 adenylate cyclase
MSNAHLLREQLEKAKGTTQHIIAIFIDIRDFSSFCKERGDPKEIATYITHVYKKVIDKYFHNAVFLKLTGDGLFIVIPCRSKSLKQVLSRTVGACLKLNEDFPKLCEDEPLINFKTPDKLGIGMTRGNAYCISCDGTIMDYSGNVINLAARLMDVARPSGIVIGGEFGIELLPSEIQSFFQEDKICVRGITDQPMPVYLTKRFTVIPPRLRQPLKEPQWQTQKIGVSFKEIKSFARKGSKRRRITLKKLPLDERQISVYYYYYDKPKKKHRIGVFSDTSSRGITSYCTGGKFGVKIEYEQVIRAMTRAGAKGKDKIFFEVRYPIA